MDPHDDDIELDFFDDEPVTGETQPAPRVRLSRPSRRRPRGPVGPPRGTAPLLRLLALVVFVIFLVLVLALLVQSCASSSKHDSYAGYMSKVDKIASLSTGDGKSVAGVLATPGVKVADIVTKLRGIADQERQNVQAAQNLGPPGKLRDENGNLIEALQLRVSGVEGLALTFQNTPSSTSISNQANLLADSADRLLASDVVWSDLFKAPADSQMKRDGVTGVSAPGSEFTTPALVTAHSMALVLQRIRGASTGGTCTGLHGTNIVSVKALPAGQTLSQGSLNTVTASTDLAFAVTVQDSGSFQEVQIPVDLTIEKGSSPIVKKETIQLINPAEQKVVTVTGLGQVPFATQTTVKVDVKPVPCEANKTNNSAQYPVIFSLPG
jgi:hypothetical protein